MSAGFDTRTGFDPTYAVRHKRRNRRKIRQILANINPGDRFLDIGCNFGYVAAALLRTNMARRVDAIELDRSVVNEALLADPRFDLYEGRVTDYPFRHVYTGTIYCAVHHHVFGISGKSQAFTTWRKIIAHSNHFVIFETGQIAEGDKYYWQRGMNRYYTTDEQHFGDLFHAIGPRLRDVRVIGYLPIHGVKRVLLKIELHPRGSSYDIPATGPDAYGKLMSDTAPWIPLKRLRRTFGSRSQKLIEVDQEARGSFSNLYNGTTFHQLRHGINGRHFFAKRAEDDPFKLLRQFKLTTQLNHPRIVRPHAVSSTFGLIFPYVAYPSLQAISVEDVKNKDWFIGQILEFFQYARETEVDLGQLDYCARRGGGKRRLIDIVDFNAANILVRLDNGMVRDWVIVDLEYVGNRNRARNEKHLAGIMAIFGYGRADMIMKNPLRFLLKLAPYFSRYARVMNRVPLYAIVDSEPGRGQPRVQALQNPWVHLCRVLSYYRGDGASVEERIFGLNGDARQTQMTGMLLRFKKKVDRIVRF